MFRMLLENKVAIVTGAARGIGFAIAQRFLGEGAKVVIADIDDEAGATAEADLARYGDGALRRMRRRRAARCAQPDHRDGRGVRQRRGAGQQRRHPLRRRFSRDGGGGLRPGDARQRQGRVPVRAGGGAPHGGVHQGRRQGRGDHQPVVGQRVDADRQPCCLRGVEGRHQRAHQGDGAGAGAATASASTRSGPAPSPPRWPRRSSPRIPTCAGRCCRARRSAGSASPSEVAGVAAFLASEDASYITGQTIYVDGGRLVLNYTVPVKE